ncbi:hypothetical protein L5G28_00905 [Gordonia sp. HY285]|uniref:hypothetical protein n=1 Tax=Gordonia liuliyuniae TaxID=2911517 RepID=UPI001F24746D|nr:hypothetical protein [Gordonia liuliyuniae]MCF8608724.1 hypothetical protein [Gordonia liuliyuniae]
MPEGKSMRNRKSILTVIGVIALIAAMAVGAWAWFATDSDDYEGNLRSAPESSDVEFTAGKVIRYLNEGTEELDERIARDSSQYTQATLQFKKAQPPTGCHYGDIIKSEHLRTEESSLGEVAIERVEAEVLCDERMSGTVAIEYGVVPEWSSWSMVTEIYSSSHSN